ncbi:hypothetical protein L6164_003563 [Bauhinia variegata]|uniref:Uncharacterized protein n=1 Tax=Bauhinia variegata TaxID=167791 RepID=A0ACB9Q132_BAUVA|nr:hypothetical protein L6164_003563 [Bauhinia variegata]
MASTTLILVQKRLSFILGCPGKKLNELFSVIGHFCLEPHRGMEFKSANKANPNFPGHETTAKLNKEQRHCRFANNLEAFLAWLQSP